MPYKQISVTLLDRTRHAGRPIKLVVDRITESRFKVRGFPIDEIRACADGTVLLLRRKSKCRLIAIHISGTDHERMLAMAPRTTDPHVETDLEAAFARARAIKATGEIQS